MELGRFGKKGSVDLNSFNQNIKKEQVKDKKMQKIYDAIDFNKDGKIDKQELTEFKKSIFTAAGNDRLSKREAKKLLKSIGLNDIKGKEMLEFLKTFSELEEEKPVVETPPAATAEPKKEIKEEVIQKPPVQEEVPPKEENPDKYGKTKTVDGKTYSVTYDGEGNTTGIIVQNGESIGMLAKKFGCTVEDIINANPDLVKGKGNNKYFLVGAEIKIPKELEPDDKALQNRQSKREAIAAYELFDNKRKAAEAERKAAEAQTKTVESEKENKVKPEEKIVQNRDLAINTQNEILKNAKADFEQQLAEDGWAGDLADGISILWNSKNRASRVKEDIAAYEKNMQQLSDASKQGDAQFKSKFKEIFDVEYNPENIAEYIKNPTQENYVKAYGTKNNMAKRVAEYNASQKKGAAAVKTTAVVAATTAAAIATGGTSLAATMVVAGVSTAASRTLVEVTDLATNDIDGDVNGENLDNIAKQAMVEGTLSAATAGLAKGAGSLLGKGAPKSAPAPKGGTPSTVPKSPAGESGLVKSTTTNTSSRAGSAGESGLVKSTTAKTSSNTGSAGKTGSTGNTSGSSTGKTGGPKANTNSKSNTAGSTGKTGGKSENAASSASPNPELNLKFRNISDKLASNGGVKNLSAADKKEIADVLGVTPDKLTKLTKSEYRSLIVKFHPDRNPGNEEFAQYVTQILNNLRTA